MRAAALLRAKQGGQAHDGGAGGGTQPVRCLQSAGGGDFADDGGGYSHQLRGVTEAALNGQNLMFVEGAARRLINGWRSPRARHMSTCGMSKVCTLTTPWLGVAVTE